jgi:hypothetical protein
MRTKPVEGVLRIDVVTLEPRPAIYLAYDGLAGLSQRPMLRDLVEELGRQGPESLKAFIEALRKRHSGQVHVYFSDYVSYGVGGGDATSEFFFGTYLLLHEPAKGGAPEELQLQRPGVTERIPLEPGAR